LKLRTFEKPATYEGRKAPHPVRPAGCSDQPLFSVFANFSLKIPKIQRKILMVTLILLM
jgi:hypothetical protein